MSFNFGGTTTTTADNIEKSFPSIVPEQHVRYQHVRIHPATSLNSSFCALLVTVLLIFVVLNSQQVSPDSLTVNYMKIIWLVFGFVLMATILRMYARCQQLEADAVETRDLLPHHTQLGLQQMPLSTAFACTGHLHGLRLQLALLDQHYLDVVAAAGYSMSEDQHKYKVVNSQSGGGALQPASLSSSFILNQKQLEIAINVEDYCTDDPWRLTTLGGGRWPTCKIKVGDEDSSSRVDASYMV